MKINCSKYQWDNSTDLKDVNLFSDVQPAAITTIDLFPYLIQDSFQNITYDFSDVDENNNTLYVKASSGSFDVIALSNERTDALLNDNLFDFFEMYSVNSFIKWKLEIFNDADELIYSGVIYKDGVEAKQREKSILNIKFIGREKEFKNYFDNQILIGTDQLTAAVLPYEVSLAGLKFYTLQEVLKKNFPNVDFAFRYDLTHFTSEYYVADKPYMYSSQILFAGGLVNIRAGYDSFVLMQTDRFAWLNSICLAYGWKWFFYLDKLYISKFIEQNSELLQLDYENILLSHDLSSRDREFQIDNVHIADGGYYSSESIEDISSRQLLIYSDTEGTYLYLGGNRIMTFSVNEFNNSVSPFGDLIFQSFPLTYIYNFDFHSTIMKYADWDWSYRSKLLSMYPAPFNHYTTTDRYLNHTKNNTVILNPLVCDIDYGGTLDMSQARNSTSPFYGNGNAYKINHDVGDNGFWFNGNAGHNLIRYINSPVVGYQTYEAYCMSEDFQSNMKKLTSSLSHNVLSLSGKGTYTNPIVNIQILNYPFENISSNIYSIDSFSFNPVTQTFEMTIIK